MTEFTTVNGVTKGVQLGRFVEVEIRNFKTETKTIISNEFEIEFEFLKTIDENQQNSTGRVTVYGLTDERIKSLQSDGGEIRLRCGYTNSEITTLFIAYIARLYPESRGNTTATIIECSANMMNYYYTGGATNKNKGKRSLAVLLADFSKSCGATNIDISLKNIPKDKHKVVLDYMMLRAFKFDMFGSADSIIDALCRNFNLTKTILDSEEGTVFRYTLTDVGVANIVKETKEGYEKLVDDEATAEQAKKFFSLYKTDEELYKEAIYLSRATGLISVKTEYKLATAYEDQELGDNEEQTLKSQQQQQQRAIKAKKQAEKDAKRIADGKTVKPKKFKRATIKVNRLYARVTALLNPMVKPQGHVVVQSRTEQYSDIYRIREITYRGNNKRGDWIMDMYCEDSRRASDKGLSAEDKQELGSETGVEVNGTVEATEGGVSE